MKFKYYNIRNLFKEYPDAQYYLVYGERSNGKTYSAKDYALEKNIKTGEQFAYIRRFGEDIRRKNLSNLFSDMIDNGRIKELTDGKFTTVNYINNKFYLGKWDEDEQKTIYMEEPCGFAFDLNAMEHYKSLSFPKITTIIFDEFISRSSYLPNEWMLFLNSLSTIIRHRDNVKVIMLGNTVNHYCIYFKEMGLKHIKEQKPGTIDVYHYGDSNLKVVCEYTESSAKKGGKASDTYFAFDNPELQMITGGAWELGIYPMLNVKLKPKDVILKFFVEFDGDILQGEIINIDEGMFIFFHPKTTPLKFEDEEIIYTTEPNEKWNYRVALTKHTDKLSVYILKCLKEGKIFYSSNEVGEIFRNYIIWSDKANIRN